MTSDGLWPPLITGDGLWPPLLTGDGLIVVIAEVSYESVLKGYQAHQGSRMATVQDVLDGIPDAHSAKAEAPKQQRSEPFTAVDMVSKPLIVQFREKGQW